MIQPTHPTLSIRRQCEVITLPLSSYYYHPVPENPDNHSLLRIIDAEYLKHPFYGVRQMTQYVNHSHPEFGPVNHKRIARLMKILGIQGIHPKKKLSIPLEKRLIQKRTARECAEWIQEKVEIRSMVKPNFLHSKMYHITQESGIENAIVGSSNFTVNGLGWGGNNKILKHNGCIIADSVGLGIGIKKHDN